MPQDKGASSLRAGMPAISLWQPFASLIFAWDRERGNFAKCFETRGFKLPTRLIGQEVAIHATAKFPAAKHISKALNDLCYDLWGCGYNYSLPFGAVIGKVRFGASIPTAEECAFQPDTEIAAGDWTPGRWAWPIIETKAWDPTPMKGRQGWWRFPVGPADAPEHPPHGDHHG
jgi:hypothetical protein